MSKRAGKAFNLYIGGYDVSPLASGVQLDTEIQTGEYVCGGGTGYHHIRGINKDTLKLDGLFDDNYMALINSLHPENLIANGNFASGDPPENWTLTGASATVSRSNAKAKFGTYSALLTRVGANCNLAQSLSVTKLAGKVATFGCWIWASVANRAKIYIDDGVGTTASAYHTGSSLWEWLTVTRTIDVSATGIYACLQIVDGNTAAYFDGAVINLGSYVNQNYYIDNQLMMPIGSTLGDPVYCCNAAKMTKSAWVHVVKDINKLSAEFNADALPFDECILLQPKAQKTTDGNGTGVDNLAQSTNGLIAYLQVLECGTDDALIVKVQMDTVANFASPTDLITFATANGITTEKATAAGTIEQYLRVTWAGTGTYQVTFAVAVKRT
jgi:hypothetical protein